MNQETVSVHHSWFALRVRSRHERVAAVHLRDRGYEEFCPTFQTESQWSDRKKVMERFIFPGYVFCKLDPNDRLPVVSVPGAMGLVSFGGGPTAIPDREIEQVQAMVRSGLLITPWPRLEIGQTVLIEHGPLAGVEGTLKEIKGRLRLLVAINLLQRAVSAEVERSWVRPVAPVPAARGDVRSTDSMLATVDYN